MICYISVHQVLSRVELVWRAEVYKECSPSPNRRTVHLVIYNRVYKLGAHHSTLVPRLVVFFLPGLNSSVNPAMKFTSSVLLGAAAGLVHSTPVEKREVNDGMS